MINVKTTERNGKVDWHHAGVGKLRSHAISQYGKIIRMDSSTIRESGRSALKASACCIWKRATASRRR